MKKSGDHLVILPRGTEPGVVNSSQTWRKLSEKNEPAQPFAARAFSSVERLSCRKKTTSDAVNAVCAREVTSLRLGEEVKPVPECSFPPDFKFVAMFRSQRNQSFVRGRQFRRPRLARQCRASYRSASPTFDESLQIGDRPALANEIVYQEVCAAVFHFAIKQRRKCKAVITAGAGMS